MQYMSITIYLYCTKRTMRDNPEKVALMLVITHVETSSPFKSD